MIKKEVSSGGGNMTNITDKNLIQKERGNWKLKTNTKAHKFETKIHGF